MLQLGLGATAGILTTAIGCKNANGETAQTGADPTNCNVTPDQTLGPFYPHVKNGDGDVDLTRIQGKEGQAEGTVILVRGRISDEQCQPVENALVEIWQANHHGRYSHEGDAANPIPLDPNFEGWGEMTTGAGGSYGFKTIKPAAYSSGDPTNPENWRTPHIHFKVSRRGYHEHISQMYFEGEKLNDTDNIIANLPEDERGQFILQPSADENGIPNFNFNITLQKVATSEERQAALDACAGKYNMQLNFGTPDAAATVRRDGDKLLLDMDGYATVELKPTGKDEFSAVSVGRRFVFNRNGDGSVNSVTLHKTSKSKPMAPVVAPKVG
jgi:protocatechuate 3,4-dioxygenase beta subunit